MYFVSRIAAGCAFVASVISIFSAAHAAPSADVFGALPAMRVPALSPDGKHLAAVEPFNGKPAVLVFALDAANTPPIAFAAPDSRPINITWVNNDRLVALFEAEKIHREREGNHLRGFVRAVSMSLAGRETIVLMKGSRAYSLTSGNTDFLGLDPAVPNRVLMGAYDLNGARLSDTRIAEAEYSYNLYTVDADTGEYDAIERGSDKTESWLVGTNGKVVARIDSDYDNTGDLLIHEGTTWHKVLTIDESAGVEPNFVNVSEDNTSLLAERFGKLGTEELDLFPLKAAAFTQTLFSNPDYDVESEVVDPWNGAVVGVSYEIERRHFQYFQPDLIRLEDALERALPGETVTLESWDKARDRFIVATETPKEPKIYNLYSTATHQLQPLASQYPSLRATDLGDMTVYDYAARDGLKIHAYLTLPPGRPAKNLPAIVFPHGGPEARDVLGFDWWAQFMATQGYAVLQPNFRGSTGYGKAFRDAGFGQWGKKMQDDISDGVRKMIADGIADPKRICIVGASYGGYAALAGATFTPDLYACAVSFAGPADLATMFGNEATNTGNNSEVEAYWESRIGIKANDVARLDAVSPAKHAANVKAPVLLLHCTDDLTVPIVQSQIEQAALAKAGKRVKFVSLKGDDHYLQIGATRVRVLQEIEKFLAANIGN